MERKIKIILCLILVFLIVILLIDNHLKQEEDTLKIVINETPTEERNNEIIIKKLKQEYDNNDLKGYIEFKANNKKFPIMQTTNNEYYLYHTPDNKQSNKGSIFLDYRVNIDTSKKLIIYGHSSRTKDFPFNFLKNYHDAEYYQNNKYIDIITGTTTKRYEIFSVYVETEDFSYMNTNFADDQDYLNHINDLKEKSIYKTKTNLSKEDEILIIQTCSTHNDYQKYKNKYLLIISRRV